MNRLAIAMLMVGLAIGWLLGRVGGAVGTGPVQSPVTLVTTNGISSGDEASLHHELDQALADNAELSEQVHATQAKLVATDDAGFLVPRKMLQHLNIEVFANGNVSPDLILLLHLNPDEAAALNRAIHIASDRLRQMQAAHASLIAQTATETKVQVDAFADEGSQVRGELAAQAQAALGADRGGIFMEMMNETGSEEFASRFGTDKMIITVTALPTENFQCKVDYGNSSETTTGSTIPSEYANLFGTDSESGSTSRK